jgi:ubiquinone/menaquinone biosynthesis C-methylase UbiE
VLIDYEGRRVGIMSPVTSEQYIRVAEANLQAYDKNACTYDRTETCVVSPRLQAMVKRDLNSIMQILPGHSERQVRALDACGGSGNIALKLLDLGADVTVCDISSELLHIYVSKCNARGLSGKVVRQEIGAFLSETDQVFDLIVFSSALHHIEDYTCVLELASKRLSTGGLIYTVFDPVRWKFPAGQIVYLDYLVFAVTKTAADIPPILVRKLKKRLRRMRSQRSMPSETADVTELDWDTLVECHVRTGIDDSSLVEAMRRIGMNVIWYEVYCDARHRFFAAMLRVFRCRTSFKLLLQR